MDCDIVTSQRSEPLIFINYVPLPIAQGQQHNKPEISALKPENSRIEPTSSNTPTALGSDALLTMADPPGSPGAEAGDGRVSMVPPCRLIVRATAGARVIGKQGANIKVGSAAVDLTC